MLREAPFSGKDRERAGYFSKTSEIGEGQLA
jgi:hypothetical protein